MKLKPLLKTHWLSSQNPMTVGLAGLQRVVFAPPLQVINSDFFINEKSALQLSPKSEVKTLAPDTTEISEMLSMNSHALSRDLFWSVFSGHNHFSGYVQHRTPAASLVQMANSIEFHFENGEVLSAVGIFRKAGFPVFLDPKFYLQDRSCNWEKALQRPEDFMAPLKIHEHQKRHEDFKRAWYVVLEILGWALQRQRQVGDLQVLVVNHLRQASALEDIEFLNPRPLAATIMSEASLKNTARIIVWNGHETQADDGLLRLYAIGALAQLETQWSQTWPQDVSVKEEERQILKDKNKNYQWQALFLTQVAENRQIAGALLQLEKTIGASNLHFVNHRIITEKSFKPFFQIRETEGSLQVAVSFHIENLTHLNFPASLASVFSPFMGGLDHFFGVERKEVASKQAMYRTNDLLLLRHNGLVLFCLLELINWKLKRPLSSGQVIEFIDDQELPAADKQFEKLIHYLKDSIPGLLGKTGAAFEETFSASAKAYFLDYIERLFMALNNDKFVFFEGDQALEIKNVQAQVLPLIRFMLLHFMEESRGRFMTRTNSTIAEKFKDSIASWTAGRVVPRDMDLEPLWVDIGLYNKYIISLLFDLTDQDIEVELNGVPFLSQDNPFEVLFSVQDGDQKDDSNLFDLHPQIFFNGERISSEEVQFNFSPDQIGFIEYRGQMYRIDKKQIPSMKSLQRFWNRIKGQREGVKHNSFGDRVYSLEKSVALELLMLKIQGIRVEASGQWKKIFDYFENGLGADKIELPEAMLTKMLPHQREGAQWLHDLHELHLGAILADEMGLGKTFQVLAFLTSLQMQHKLKKCLVVVPTSLVYNWIDEKKKFAPDLPVQAFISSDKEKVSEQLKLDEPLVLITTYGLLNENIEFFEKHNWNILAFDEAQNLKNITALRSVSARKLKADFKICLTGTPMENNYLEFYSLCDLVVPGCLGDVDSFRKKYYNNEVKSEALRELRLISKPLLLRRTKAQVKLSLPVKTLQKVLLPFGEKQKEIYKKMAMTFSRQVDDLIQEKGERKAQIAMFAALMRLRQICSDPAAVPSVIYEEQPVKVEHFLNSLQDHLQNDESVIVFTQFLSTLTRIERELQKIKVPTYTLQGRVKSKERLRLIDAFQNNPEPGVMLMTLKTGGVGLNLTKASVVYHLEPWWNPAVENQASDRAHRMGQTKDVTVYNLLIEGSLEERIADLKVKKQNSFDRLFGVDEQIDENSFQEETGLSREDFLYLLKSDV
jgi:SNF2 family DNA or RNA helicase